MSEHDDLTKQVHQSIADLFAPHKVIDAVATKRLSFYGKIPKFDTKHKLTVPISSAIGAYALGIEKWWHMASGEHQTVAMDWVQAASALNPGEFQKQSGCPFPALSLLTELKADFFKTQDERWFFPIGSYPHLRDAVLDTLNCPNNAQALSASIGKWKATDLEEEFARRKIPGVFARSRDEWLEHPQGRWLASTPTIEIIKIADSEPEPARATSRPLDQLRVLDLGHVIAGPIVARSLAEQGAEVLRLTHPMLQDPFRQVIDTNIGKRSAFINLDLEKEKQKVLELCAGADVVVQSWRPGSMAKRGLGPDQLAAIRPGLIYVTVTAFGDGGPWQERGGFEQLGQTICGVAVTEGNAERPRLVPTYLLNDYLAGYLGAAGVMMALIRRATEGGSYHVKVSLTKASMWVQDHGLESEIDPRVKGKRFTADLNPILETRDSPYGVLEQLAPVAQFSRTQAYWSLPPVPNGAHYPNWLTNK